MENLKFGKMDLKKFGITMGVAFLAVSILFFLRQKHGGAVSSLLISSVFFITGLILPILLKPIYIIWMRFAFILSWVNTRIILIILFYLVFAPIGLAMRLFKVDLLERSKKKESYWKKKEKPDFNPSNYERQF